MNQQQQQKDPIQNDEQRRQWLYDNGAIQGVHGPVKIKAEKVNSNTTTTMDDAKQETKKDDARIISKIIHFQRHGQGYHNLLYTMFMQQQQNNNNEEMMMDIYNPDPIINPFVRSEIIDAPLTSLGRTQCQQQQQQNMHIKPQLVIVSPLHRALQTAQITFQHVLLENEKDSSNNKIPFIAHEGCREELGILTCNQRRPLMETKHDFPNIDFSLLLHDDEDVLWNPTKQESPLEQSKRIYDFLVNFVQHQSQTEIAIVGHSSWLFTMCNCVLDCCTNDGNNDKNDLTSWFETAEIRTMKLTWSVSSDDDDDDDEDS